MNNKTLALVTFAALGATTASCAALIGLNQDYQESSSASGAGGAPAGSVNASSGNGGANSTSAGMGGASSVSSSGSGVVAMPGCTGLPATCGPNGDEDCCKTLPVTGGTFYRDNVVNDNTYKATISSFKLDRFEVTLGRFRRFVEGYPGNLPNAGDGAHPKIMGSGWNPIWKNSMPKTKAGLIAQIIANCNHPPDPYFPVWTDQPGQNEDKAMNCIDWYTSFAFCAWDGGRLPTNAELSFAESGGSDQRLYPWGSQMPDGNYAVYNCMGDNSPPQDCKGSDLLAVGSRSPTGDGKFGQADLAGNVWEWVLDTFEGSYQSPCVDCALLGPSTERTIRGGGWGNNNAIIQSDSADWPLPNNEADALGVRCARQ